MLWDIFCRVIDNHGDLGVCWRLSADLASRGHSIRLWVDDASALVWMAPDAKPNAEGRAQLITTTGSVVVRAWHDALHGLDQPSDVWVEAFGCELPDHFVHGAHQSQTKDYSFENMKSAIIVGSALASFCVEKFGTHRLTEISMADIKERIQSFVQLVNFDIELV
jgi:uncharacterized repeat protein (TIGR03837 family)